MTAIPFLLCLTVPASLYAEIWLANHYGTGLWYLLTIAVVLVVQPILDSALPLATHGPLKRQSWFTLFLWIQIPILYALTYFVLRSAEPLGWAASLALAVGLGAANGAAGITAAHEMIHRVNARDRAGGLVLLLLVNYMAYRIEHISGHHKNVATPEDPATGRLGESIYCFWLRNLPTSFLGSWRTECQRLQSRRRVIYGVQNRMLQYLFLEFSLAVLVFTIFGWKGVLLFWVQSLIAILFLELVNYIEHYGLVRKKLAGGGYEPATAAHSWDSYHRLSNWMLFNLGRHAHHHLRPTCRYETLETIKESPKLPLGYSGLILIVLVPPLWRRVMNHRIPNPT